MASYVGTEFNDLAKLLFNTISNLKPEFDPIEYLDAFESMKTNLDKVNFVYADIKKYPNVFAKYMKDTKSDELAFTHIDGGKRKCLVGKYWDALEDFTQSVAAAESETVLALGYGHRAECFLKLEMPDKCLEEVERASAGYPKDLIEKLVEIKTQAESMVPCLSSYYESLPGDDFDNCIRVERDDKFGTHVVATRDVEVGDIIMIEEPFTSVLTSDRLTHCHQCQNLCYNPVPCNKCTVALFCSDSCKNEAQSYHKYECPILLTICYRVRCEFAADSSILLALKIALLTKECYPQKEMLQLKDSDKYLVVHFLKSRAMFSRFDIFHQAILTAVIYELLWNYTSFFSGIFATSRTSDTFKEIMLVQLQTTLSNVATIYEYVQKLNYNGTNNFGVGAYSLFSLFTHSCCANVMKTFHGNKLVLRALNTIKEGEQCFVNRYGLRYDVSSTLDREQYFITQKLQKCLCKACEEHWSANLGDVAKICEDLNIDVIELGDIVRSVIGSDVQKARNFLPTLITQLKECEDLEPQGSALALKSLIAHCYVIFGNKKIECDKSIAEIGFVP
ncbi:SET and MYND domain-containing protein 4-like [Zophobas morio]|uniref:SET and MYND domain-containing protein 4-like n=1 Tax=Zophobas morio TaxID=2755281 RepID=UPI003083ABB4